MGTFFVVSKGPPPAVSWAALLKSSKLNPKGHPTSLLEKQPSQPALHLFSSLFLLLPYDTHSLSIHFWSLVNRQISFYLSLIFFCAVVCNKKKIATPNFESTTPSFITHAIREEPYEHTRHTCFNTLNLTPPPHLCERSILQPFRSPQPARCLPPV